MQNVTQSVTIVNMDQLTTPVRAPELATWALAHGRGSLTSDEVARLLGVDTSQVRQRLNAPARRGEWVQPTRGLWVPVPPEYRTWGAPPGIEIIDAMMRHRGIGYYVGWLSAAAIYGAAHQAPQVFQVAVDRHMRDRVVGRTRFVFAQRGITSIPTIAHPTRDGSARVSSVAATMLDVADDLMRAAGIDNAATVIIELSEHELFDVNDLARLAPSFPAAAGRRVGWFLSQFTDRDDLGPLRQVVRDAVTSVSHLEPHTPATGPVDSNWRILINRDVEPDA
ncbi:MAG: type IV toxin-antitoxin system AbiEi family antitoxin [Propioniciclava sp.]|uniref:type IV toxin-antitoxin system AbiEi family antitoxin domain-containing protein n=1 Tax=Propioniciclava sp. TaxID=2038686 RepID=UPI0039E6AB36